jgi:hypothetical protein
VLDLTGLERTGRGPVEAPYSTRPGDVTTPFRVPSVSVCCCISAQPGMSNEGEECIMRSFIICTLCHDQGGGCRVMWYRRDKRCIILSGKPERKRSFGRPRCKWKNNIKMDLTKITWECELDSTILGYGPMTGLQPSGSTKGRKLLDCHLLKKSYFPSAVLV